MPYLFPRKLTPKEKQEQENRWLLAISHAKNCLALAIKILPDLPDQSTRLALETIEYLRSLGIDDLPQEGEPDIFYEDLFTAWLQDETPVVQLGSIKKWIDDLTHWQNECLRRFYKGDKAWIPERPIEGEQILQTFLEDQNQPLSAEAEKEALKEGLYWLWEALTLFELDGDTLEVARLLERAFELLKDTREAPRINRIRSSLLCDVVIGIMNECEICLKQTMWEVFDWFEATAQE